MADQRKAAEQHFYDQAYETGVVDTKNGFYEISAGIQRFRELIFADVEGKKILEYGCGLGGHAFSLAERGATVTGIDISEVAVMKARHRAMAYPAGTLTFVTADAEALQFEDESYDLVCGTGILHHLDLARSIAEVRRVLKVGGRGVFYEPLGHNPLLNLYRWLTPGSHTPDEHPLRMSDIESIHRPFRTARADFFDLFSVFVIPVLWLPGGTRLLRIAESMDRWMFRVLPMARPWGAVVVLELTK